MSGPGIVGLPSAHDVLAAVGVAEPHPTLEEVPPVRARAGVIGQPLEKLRIVEVGRYRLEADVVVPKLAHSPLVVAQLWEANPLWLYLVLGCMHLHHRHAFLVSRRGP